MKTLLPVLAMAASLAPALAQADKGDLDPSFADHGRQSEIPGASGVARSVELPDTGGVFVGGGRTVVLRQNFETCTATAASFATRLGEDGSGDPAFDPASMAGIEAMDVARQADGRIVGVGRKVRNSAAIGGRCILRNETLAVFRLDDDGSLDTGFGAGGTFDWDAGALSGKHQARSVLLEADGRIVVAGTGFVAVGDTADSRLLVLRLLADGGLDESFGDGGVFVGPTADFRDHVRIVRTQAGNYRVTGTGTAGCVVVGVTTAGARDASFGQAGVAPIAFAGGGLAACAGLESRADDRLLLAGSVEMRGFVTRLLSNGMPDPAFAPAGALAASLNSVTAITSAVDGSIFVAGSGPTGASITRLDATGALDASFGDSGHTWIDLASEGASTPIVQDMVLREDGSVVAAGGDLTNRPFVVRLLGDAGGTSAGVVGFSRADVAPQEVDGQAVIRVRRSGGKDGGVSVDYRTVAGDGATADDDFTPTEGTLHWADGDRSEREIVVEISRDDGPPEATESFRIELADAQGGAGMGLSNATVDIQPDGAPGGQIQVFDIYGYGPGIAIATEDSPAQIGLSRDYYNLGRVCVTVTTRPGTAIAGEDFTATTSTHCWDDQDAEVKVVEIPMLEDALAEEDETFTVELSNPTGGAILGLQSTATVTILANDASEPPPPPPPAPVDNNVGGGGSIGVVELLLALGTLLARRRRRA